MGSCDYTVVILGGVGTGKSALTIQFISGVFIDTYDPTIEDSFRKQIVVDENAILLTILDTAGAEEFHSIRDLNMRQSHGALLVFSLTDRASFYALDRFYNDFLQAHDIGPDGTLPILLVGTKSDLTTGRQITDQEIKEKASSLGLAYFPTSAKACTGIEETFFGIVRAIRQYRQHVDAGSSNQKKSRVCILL